MVTEPMVVAVRPDDKILCFRRVNHLLYGYFYRKVSFWLFKIFKIQKGDTFSFNDILRLCTMVGNIAIRSHA